MGQSNVHKIKFLLRTKDNMVTQSKRLLVIYNPTAGQNHERRFWKILKLLEARGCQLTLSQTERPGHAIELAADATNDPEITSVIAAGGDGTLAEVAQGLRGSEMPLGLIPLGTANVFACEIGVGTTPRKIVDAIVEGRQTQIWPGLIKDRRFLLMIGCGYDSVAVAGLNSAQKRKWGAVAYLLSAIRVRHHFSKLDVRVSFGGREYMGASAVVSRAQKYGGPFTVFPGANLERRDLQVLLLKNKGLGHAVLYGLAMAFNFLPKLASVKSFSTGEVVKLSSSGNLACQRDGDLDVATPVEISVDSLPLNFLMPYGK